MRDDGDVARRVRVARASGGAAAAVVAGGVLLLALWLGGGRPQPPIPGLPDAGPVTGWLLPVGRLALDAAAIATVGFVVVGVALIPRSGDALGDHATAYLRAAARWALLWSVLAALTVVLSLSDVLGMPVRELLAGRGLTRYVWSLDAGRAFGSAAAVAALVAILAPRTRRFRGGVALTLVALAGLAPLAFAGHSAPAVSGDAATASLMIHLFAVTLWVGGLVGIVLRRRALGPLLADVVPRFSTLALWCFVVVAVSGVVNAWLRLGPPSGLWWSGYGLLVLGKVAALVTLGGFGWWHRRHTVRTIAGRPTQAAFARFAAAEVIVMAAAIGLAVALSRTPVPHP